VKAAQVVRAHAPDLAVAHGCLNRLTAVLTIIGQVVQRTARINTRRTHPNTWQRIAAFTTLAE
ncbi:MAG: hypothetical protein M3R61_14645, partial [Chloroflexota bacterium]|nr:hypothetical protein [Chloroflexota bacterium]